MTNREIIVIGGGIIGLSLALELKQRSRDSRVTVLSRDDREAALYTAAGMLAPQSEAIPPGPMLDLCLRSRSMYPEWTRQLQEISGIDPGYWACGFLAPFYAGEEADASPPQHNLAPSYWLDREQIREFQPYLGEEVAGGWWYPEDAQANTGMLGKALRTAIAEVGVELREGVTVEAIVQAKGRVAKLQTTAGDFTADQYVLATGAWSQQLLPIPVSPKKGQMFSVRIPGAGGNTNGQTNSKFADLPLHRVLFGPYTYIVPRRDGTIVVGATVEDAGLTPYNTPAGIHALLGRAMRLFPLLRDYPLERVWWGFRPTPPDELPILGSSPCENLTLATGHHRNGILLAPVTAQILADWMLDGNADPLLAHFHWRRFQPSHSPAYEENGGNGDRGTSISHVSPQDGKTMQFATPKHNFDSNYIPEWNGSSDRLEIGDRCFRSRLITGTGKYRNISEMQHSLTASGCEMVTVAIRRVQNNAPGHEGLAEAIDWNQIWMLPNTAGCKTPDDAIRVARLGREMAKMLGQEDNNFVKLEVIPDPTYLLPDPVGTLEAAEKLIREGFTVLPYINADPILAKRLEEVGCATVMPLGSPIGSGQGIQTAANVQIIIENAQVPVVVDAGIGTPSEAAQAMEMGADAVLINTAIAQAKNPPAMARAMAMAVEAGRLARAAGRIPVAQRANASSPLTGTITS
ncbi:glycine oxidase ThiO [Geitlerinema sp. PCC 9228]|uniref:glycine oxidase ThiO n=1 Tax=Geitlerinema sp. PCC 9228 TaxID=111611 RepID=UPI0008F9BD8D|nr:glycine oxidase ThiO [Geitlerinema sp. PCC 9228]